MKRCYACRGGNVKNAMEAVSRTVAGRTFEATLPLVTCASCGEGTFHGADLRAFDYAVARELALGDEISAEAFRFMRSAVGISGVELAELLRVTPETVSRWCMGKVPIDPGTFILVASLVLDKLEGRTTTADRLRATHLAEPRSVPLPPVRLALRHA